MKIFLLIVIISFNSFCQTSGLKIKGKVIDDENLEPIMPAILLVLDSYYGTMTDTNGNFTLILPEGKNQIKVSAIGYESKNLILLCVDSNSSFDNSLTIKLRDLHFGSGPVIFYSRIVDSTETRARIDALNSLAKGNFILLQNSSIREIENIYSQKYFIQFIEDIDGNSVYRIAFNEIILAELANKYGFGILDELKTIDWINK